MPRLIVPGGSGFIGRNLVSAVPHDWEVVALYHSSIDFPAWIKREGLDHVSAVCCDMTNETEIHELTRRVGAHFDACVFLAANGDPAYSVAHPLEDLSATVVTLLQFLSHFEIDQLVYFSSGAVYDGLRGLVSPDTAVSPRLPYAISNWASEHYVRTFARQGRIGRYVNVRFFGAYGPHEPPRKIYSKLVKRFAFERQPQFTIHGDGLNYIDAMYVEDTAQGILSILGGGEGNFTLDFCSGAPLTINELVQTAARIFGVDDLEIDHIGQVPEYINFYVSGDAMAKRFNFRPRIPLETGLERLADFLRTQMDSTDE